MRRLLGWTVVLGMMGAGAAAAQEQVQQEVRKETSVFLKGGLGAYTAGMGTTGAVGPTWGLTVDFQPLRILGLELGYEGSNNQLSAVTGSTSVLRNGADALLKVAPPFIERVKPFVGAGLGASYVGIRSSGSGLSRGGIMEEVPLAAGVEFNTPSLTAGVRATYRVLVNQPVVQDVPVTGGGLFDASVTLGGRF